ncbi:MAG: hypothetical protein AAB348_01080 [Patescibacteria group bacterium]
MAAAALAAIADSLMRKNRNSRCGGALWRFANAVDVTAGKLKGLPALGRRALAELKYILFETARPDKRG